MSSTKIDSKRTKLLKILFLLDIVFLLLIVAMLYLSKDLGKLPVISVLFPDTGVAVSPFLSTSGTKIYVNGEEYRFTGVNAFKLGSFAGNAGCGGPVDDLDAFFAKIRPNSTVRMWAFQGSMATNIETKQIDWSGLDRAVDAAARNGIKLIFTLGDQAGTCDDGHWKDKAWYREGYRQAYNDTGNGLTPLPYLDYVKLIVERYKDSPVIAMWEPINEPSSADCVGAAGTGCYAKQTCDEGEARIALRSFFDTVGGEIKRIDKNHIIGSGVIGDGQCGAVFEDYQYLHESPGIDVASYHDYNRDDQPMPGDEWNGLQKRLNQMRIINKPLIVGEVGMLAKDNTPGCMSYDMRRDKLKAKMDAQFAAGIAGFIPWALTGGVSQTCNYDIVDNDPTLDLLRNYPVSMGTFTDIVAPSAPTNLTASNVSVSQATLTWGASTDRVGVVRYDVFRNDNYITSSTETSAIISNLSQGTHVFHVKGKDAAGNSSVSSNTVSITPVPDTAAPSAPILIAISPTEVTLTWKASNDNVGVVRYDIFRNDSYATSTTETNVTITNLSPGTSYTFHIKGKDMAGNNSSSSNKVTVTTPRQ